MRYCPASKFLALLGLLPMLSGCHIDARYAAAEDVRTFLMAAASNDMAEFEAHVDRARVKADVLRQVRSGAVVARGGNVERLTARLLEPKNFTVAVGDAPAGKQLPGRFNFALALQWLAADRVCLPAGPRKERCAITFEKEGRSWKLVGIRAMTFLPAMPKEDR